MAKLDNRKVDTQRIKLNVYQAEFIKSEKRFPALISSIGTGKTFMLLLKCMSFSEQFPGSKSLIIRKEFTDLRDSTMSDFETYFGVKIGSDKNYKLANGSEIMFRHGGEFNVLKNLNLNFIGIEQAEEFDDPDAFDFLRDRLRRKDSPYRQFCIIANARGHNWIWKRWIDSAEKVDVLNAETGERIYHTRDYFGVTANTLANKHNLPDDFIADLMSMETEAPNHFQQYVMNSFEQLEEDDYLFNLEDLENCLKVEFLYNGYYDIVMGVDIARYGSDSSVATILQYRGGKKWEQIHRVEWNKKDTMESVGRIIELKGRYKPAVLVIDGDGIGAGVVDRLNEVGLRVIEFRGGQKAKLSEEYFNKRTEAYCSLRECVSRTDMKLKNKEITGSLQTIRYKFDSKGRKQIVSKEQMKKDGNHSPDDADSLMMAWYGTDLVGNKDYDSNVTTFSRPTYAPKQSLFGIAGMK